MRDYVQTSKAQSRADNIYHKKWSENKEYKKTMTFAVDFDGTIRFKDGKPNMLLIQKLRGLQSTGNVVILHTSRTGKALNDAVLYSAKYGLRFSAVYGGKPIADYYIDDKAIKP